MFKNYLKIAWRNILKDKLFTLVKVGGLALGIALCLLIGLLIRDEVSFDSHYEKKEQIYRVYMQGSINGETLRSVHFQLPLAKVLKEDYPEIIKAGRFNNSESFGAGARPLRVQGVSQSTVEKGFALVDQNLLEILEVPLKYGNEASALTNPRSMVISERKADKYFPRGNALGKTVILDNDTQNPYEITGVMEDLPGNSHFSADFLLKIEDDNNSWTSTNYFTYVLINDKADPDKLGKDISAVIANYIIPGFKQAGRNGVAEMLKNVVIKLQPIQDIHLKTPPDMMDQLRHGDIRFVWLFASIAIFILALACFNFINLSTAKSANRAKEVGLRKTIGAKSGSLIYQFLVESVVFSFIAFIIGLVLARLILPFFNTIAAKDLGIPWGELWFFPTFLLLSIFIGILAGAYPAFYLSSFKPLAVLKGQLSTGGKSKKLRSALVVFQFTISVILIIGTIIIYRQMNFILNKNLGYDKEQVLVVHGANSLGNSVQNFKDQLLNIPSVKGVTVSDYLPVDNSSRNINSFNKPGDADSEYRAQNWVVDVDYIKTLGMNILEGRDFSKNIASDSTNAIIINQTMARELGFQNPIGQKINNGNAWTIIGVVKDFHFNSLKQDITPLAMVLGSSSGLVSVKLETRNIEETIRSIDDVWLGSVPDQAFSYTFLNQDFATMHSEVKRMGIILNSFAFFAILVACLGLFALAVFMVEQRMKEISMRKVLGASFESIYKLLTFSFLKLVLISIIIAVPFSWFLMGRWLQDFAYRISIGWQVFIIAGLLVVVIAILTISYQSVKAALIKPLKSLKIE